MILGNVLVMVKYEVEEDDNSDNNDMGVIDSDIEDCSVVTDCVAVNSGVQSKICSKC